ncbi:MAG: peptide chain release factor 2 [Patescibacteria group bacterium]|nr:peptide chain release factor 2 [Patescibacteria group bacterium]
MGSPAFWDDRKTATQVSKDLNSLQNAVNGWEALEKEIADLAQLAEMTEKQGDIETEKELTAQLFALEKRFNTFRLEVLLSGPYDDHNALVSLHSGAGGTDAQDWAEILLRMYLRYAEKSGYTTEIINRTVGSEAGIKSAVVKVAGPYAFGHFKSEAGVHRLIRLSPFNPAHTRETSFALVEVLPELAEDEESKIDPKDLKIEVSTASGHGGQSVNTTYSAVRLTHIPTGIKVSIQNERSQVQNKTQAMKILQGKLKLLEEERRQQEKLQIRGEFHSAEWGNQIRSYTIHPYKLVKDHRTNLESTDPESVFDGDLEEFVAAYLEKQSK